MAAGAVQPADARTPLLEEAGLSWQGSSLAVQGIRLTEIADRVGTPVFVYNAEIIRSRYRTLTHALAGIPHRVCYAVKANSALAVLRVLREEGAGADLVSGGELARALAVGFAPADLVFSGVGKTEEELRAAVSHGVGHVNVESREELAALGRVADALGRSVSVGIRVNPDVTAETHPYITTGREGIKFGLPVDQVREAAAWIGAHSRLELTALAMHLGSQLLQPEPYREGAKKLLDLLRTIRTDGADRLRFLDVGGGIGIRYGDEPGLDPSALAECLRPVLAGTGLTLLLEPGRYLTGSAGVLLTTVLYRKHSGGRDFVIVDAGMNDFLRPSLYRAHHEISEIEAGAGRGTVAPVDIVGPVCETGDFFALQRSLPPMASGDRLAILGAGAYGFVMSSNYNTRLRAAEVLVDGGRFGVARRRERVEDLLALEQADPWAGGS